ncbi:hypothetical protein VCHENC02_2876B, partial [Vibrio harveyi]|jgi:hypothetical protein
VPNP